MPLLLLALFACQTAPPETTGDAADDSVVSTLDSEPAVSLQPYEGPAYAPCVTDAQCDAGSACASVPGYAGLYCAPPCEPGDDAACALPGLDFETTCLSNGRCARACGEPDSCPESLECSAEPVADELTLCAGGEYGTSGYYGTCSHPLVDGPDCPLESTCFGGDYIGVDEGACLPWCTTGECPSPPDDASGVSPLCYDGELDYPICVLLCVPDASDCPGDQECFSLGSVGICAPPGAEY
ncbi:MAG: hypothetical protein H6741_16260 [Alphaproteobacteria bacterium]|nr:hypothetical protein [Alphaproteobacteria bacterium]MCB9794268.1 hypothetical protein [Alphaproteobacteria bacterium]